jgi:hypothetical protein
MGVLNIKEALASGSVTPGMLVKRSSATQVVAHNVAGGFAQKLFAIEDDLQGKGVSDVYATTTRLRFHTAARGDEIAALITTGQTLVAGDLLMSDGAGKLTKFVAQDTGDLDSTDGGVAIVTGQVVAVALEAVTTAPDGTRLLVEVV